MESRGFSDPEGVILDVLSDVLQQFDDEERKLRRYRTVVWKWPTVTDEEYILILPTIWVNDWFNQEQLCQMPYRDFLRTRYWKAISWNAKRKHPWCQECAEYLQQLHVHHKTYVRRGLECLFPDDLVVLCHSCHRREHRRAKWDA